MGHSDIATTLNVYTHLKLEDAQDELEKLKMKEQIKKEMALLDMAEARKELRKGLPTADSMGWYRKY